MARDHDANNANFLKVADTPLSGGYPLSIACFFVADAQAQYTLCGLHDEATGGGRVTLTRSAGRFIQGSVATSSVESANATGAGTNGTIEHAAFCVDTGTSNGHVYRDGVSGSGVTFTLTPHSALDNVMIGARQNNSGVTEAFDGAIWSVGIWTAKLTDAEVAALAKGASPLIVRPQSLVRYYPVWGRGSTEPELRAGVGITVNGTLNYRGERPIGYFAGKRSSFLPTTAAGGGATVGRGLIRTPKAERMRLVA